MITVYRKSPRTGLGNTMDLDITPEQIAAYDAGALLQNAFPNLSKAEREFYKTGYTQDDWDAIFGPTVDEKLLEGGVVEASTLFGSLKDCIRKYGEAIVPASFTAGNVEYWGKSVRQNGDGEVIAWEYRGDDPKETSIVVLND